MTHEVLSYFKGNFGQFYHKLAHLSFVEASRWIDEYRDNKNLKEKYKELIDCLKNNIEVNSYKYKFDNEEFKKAFPHGYAVVNKSNLHLRVSTARKIREFLGNDFGTLDAANELFKKHGLKKGDFFKNFIFISKYDDKQVFIRLVSIPYILNKLRICSFGDITEDGFKVLKEFLFSYTCEQLNEWGKSDYSPVVALCYKKYDSIDDISSLKNFKK